MPDVDFACKSFSLKVKRHQRNRKKGGNRRVGRRDQCSGIRQDLTFLKLHYRTLNDDFFLFLYLRYVLAPRKELEKGIRKKNQLSQFAGLTNSFVFTANCDAAQSDPKL